ncbi:MAG: Cell envelope-related transcriptional attenuator [Chloroflexi bacterium]|nr:MAG: Cell envelope-related transcriptional attenuator [Chloroflexota bacterium]
MVMRKVFAVMLGVAFLLNGCNLPFSSSVNPTPIPITDILINLDPNTAPTPTPFQPIPPTPTIGFTSTPVVTNEPTAQTVETNPAIVNLGLERPAGQVNILMLGSDYRPGRSYRTDVIMVLSLNPDKGTASITSFPRDLYVELPGVGMERINSAQAFGGFALTAAAFKNNFDVPLDYYVMTTFNGFEGIVDTLGGINVYAAYSLSDTCALPQAVDKSCYIPAGQNYMNGETALWYVRSRHSSSDFDRTRRAQEVISAIFQKAISLDAINRGPELYNMFRSNVETNIPLATVIQLLPFSSKIIGNPALVRRYAIGAANTYSYIVPGNGAMVLIPDPQSIGEIIRQAIYQ